MPAAFAGMKEMALTRAHHHNQSLHPGRQVWASAQGCREVRQRPARTDGERIWCRVPRDIVQVRKESPGLAREWRKAVRGVFTDAFADGYIATSMSRDGWYELERQKESNA